MKSILFILLVISTFVYTKVPPGVVEQIYSTKGLIDHYKSLFKHSGHTFESHDMGSITETKGWSVFGTSMKIHKTSLDEYSFGMINKVNLVDNSYDFEISSTTGVLKYTWTYYYSAVPYNHQAECKFSVPTHHLLQKFEMVNDKLKISRSLEYPSGAPKLVCDDSLSLGDDNHEWMVEVRKKYEEKLSVYFAEAISKWLTEVDNIFTTTSSAELDDLTYSLSSHLKQAEPDQSSNLVVGYNYDITLHKKKRSPVNTQEIDRLSNSGDLTTYFFEEYFQSLLELDKEAVDFWAAVNSEDLPEGSTYGMIAKDFRYIIDGMQQFDGNTAVTVGCEYGSGKAQAHLHQDAGVELTLPLTCTLRAGNTKALVANFDYAITGIPEISPDGTITLSGIDYSVDNFSAENFIGGRVLNDYLVNRIIEYSVLEDPIDGMSYNDGRFAGMNNFKITSGEQYLRVEANIPD